MVVAARRRPFGGFIAREEIVTASPPPAIKLSIIETVGASYDALWEHRDDAFRLAAVPAVLFLALQLFLSWQFAAATPEGEGAFDPANPPSLDPWFIPATLLSLIPATLFSVNWQRVLLLGPAAAPGLGLHWGRRETTFLATVFAIALAAMLAAIVVAIPVVAIFMVLQATMNNVVGPAGPGTGLPILPIVATALPVVIAEIYVSVRLMPALTGAALDQRGNLRLSWRMTRGNVLRIFAAFLLGVFPFYIGAFVLELLLGMTGLFANVPITGTFLVVLVGLLLSAAGSAVMATVYRRLGGANRASV